MLIPKGVPCFSIYDFVYRKIKDWKQENTNFSSCVDVMKKFASRIRKAANLERQAKRIESFKKINEKKVLKVTRSYLSCSFFGFKARQNAVYFNL